MSPIALIMTTLFSFSVLSPTKLWFPPDQPVAVKVSYKEAVRLVLTDFTGSVQKELPVENDQTVDVRQMLPSKSGATYLLYAVPGDKPVTAFVGTPLVVQVRVDKSDPNAGPLVYRVEPLRYALMQTSAGPMLFALYYDVAPNTVTNFMRLAEEGYYDGIGFHRIISNFVVQAGDPLSGDAERAGRGGPGFMIDQEFNSRPHVRGVLSMARQGDKREQQGEMPGSDAANSASSQFFICLDYSRTKALDGKYTAFGKLSDGTETLDKLAKTPTGANDRPKELPVIKSIKIVPVSPGQNPYEKMD